MDLFNTGFRCLIKSLIAFNSRTNQNLDVRAN